MPRRPRPADRPAPKSGAVSARRYKPTNYSITSPKRQHITFAETELESESQSEQIDHGEKGMSGEDAEYASSDSGPGHEEEDVDVDAPRVAQWEPDELEFNDSVEGEDEENAPNSAGPSHVQLTSLQNDLSSLPLGILRKAQRALARVRTVSDSGDDNSSVEGASEDEPETYGIDPKRKRQEKPEWSTKPRTDLAKRSSKHAPQEVTSKRPVTRRRAVVEVKVQQPRDPRFLPVAGEFSDRKFQEQYGFLADIHTAELKTLRENVKRARKLLTSSPRGLLEERQQEVTRLESALKRAESSVNKDKREMVEQMALSRIAKEERDKRKQGKGGWWMKESDKKDFLVRARYDALAATGGKGAVKKAIEKKRKKISEKEKKSRPFAREGPGSGDRQKLSHGKRPFNSGSEPEGGRFEKRRRVR